MTSLLDFAEILPEFFFVRKAENGDEFCRNSPKAAVLRFRHGSVTVPVGRALYTNFRERTLASSSAQPAAAVRDRQERNKRARGRHDEAPDNEAPPHLPQSAECLR